MGKLKKEKKDKGEAADGETTLNTTETPAEVRFW
jgi:hypothetical protein